MKQIQNDAQSGIIKEQKGGKTMISHVYHNTKYLLFLLHDPVIINTTRLSITHKLLYITSEIRIQMFPNSNNLNRKENNKPAALFFSIKFILINEIADYQAI